MGNLDDLHTWCKFCKTADTKRRRDADPVKALDTNLRAHYGIGLAEYRKLEARQKGVCAICRKPETRKGTKGITNNPPKIM